MNVFAKYKTFFMLNDLCHFNTISCYIRNIISFWNELCHCTHIILYFIVNYYYRYDPCVSTGRSSSILLLYIDHSGLIEAMICNMSIMDVDNIN